MLGSIPMLDLMSHKLYISIRIQRVDGRIVDKNCPCRDESSIVLILYPGSEVRTLKYLQYEKK